MKTSSYDADVLIVGFGPTGATLACLLAAEDVSTLVVDRALEMHALPRAVHFDAEIMRIFQKLDLVQDIEPHVVALPDYEFRTASGELLMRIPSQSMTPQGWASGYMFHQPGLEGAIRRRAQQGRRTEFRLGAEFRSLSQDSEGVSVTIDGQDGERQVRCRYVVACDGGSSPVREASGLSLEDMAFDEPWLVVDVKLGPGSRTPDVNLQICDPKRPTTCVLSGPGRHRWEFMLLPGETRETAMADGFVEDLIARWEVGSDYQIERRAYYRFHGLLAHSWRDRRVLVAGDAAHQMPPMAGQGMCAGIRDAANVAWKLAAVLRGEAADSVLDTYQAERAPHAREVITLAIDLGRVVCATDPEVAAARDAQLLAARAAGAPPPAMVFSPFKTGLLRAGSAGAGELLPQPVAGLGEDLRRLDDVLGPGAWLIARSAAGAHAAGVASDVRPVGLDDTRLHPFAGALADWLDAHAAEAVLVRPDRVVFGTGEATELAKAYRDAMAPVQAKAA